MAKRIYIAVYMAFCFSGLPALGNDGVIGATCSTHAYCPKSSVDSSNACGNVGPKFFPGVLMLAAKEAIIRECQKANALDYCGAFSQGLDRSTIEEQHGGGCYEQCSEQVLCLYGDNR